MTRLGQDEETESPPSTNLSPPFISKGHCQTTNTRIMSILCDSCFLIIFQLGQEVVYHFLQARYWFEWFQQLSFLQFPIVFQLLLSPTHK